MTDEEVPSEGGPHEPSAEERANAVGERIKQVDASRLSEEEQMLTALLAFVVYKLGGAVYMSKAEYETRYNLHMQWENEGIRLMSLPAEGF